MRLKRLLCACWVDSLYSLYSLLEDPFLCIRCGPKTTRSKTTVHSAIQTTSRDRTSISEESPQNAEKKNHAQTPHTRAVYLVKGDRRIAARERERAAESFPRVDRSGELFFQAAAFAEQGFEARDVLLRVRLIFIISAQDIAQAFEGFE